MAALCIGWRWCGGLVGVGGLAGLVDWLWCCLIALDAATARSMTVLGFGFWVLVLVLGRGCGLGSGLGLGFGRGCGLWHLLFCT